MESPLTIRREIDGGSHSAALWKGDESGPRILGIHGFTGSGLDWGPIAERLPQTVLAPDLLGHGGSPAPSDLEAYRIHSVVNHCLSWCETGSEWVIVGYSMGGRVALRLAPLLGKRLRALVLISASPGIENPVERAERIAQDYALAGRIEEEGMDWFRAHWAEVPIIRSQAKIPSEVYAAMQERRKQNRPAGLAGSLRGMGQGAVDPVWAHLRQFHVPTLVISGVQDEGYTEIARQTVAGMAHAQHVCIESAGHCTHLEAIEPTVDVLQSFLSSIG